VQIGVTGGVDHASLRDLFFAPPSLQSQQGLLPGTLITNHARVALENYGANLVHQFTTSWIQATTSLGYSDDGRDDHQPVLKSVGLSSGSPPLGSIETEYLTSTVWDRSFYGQEQVVTLASRLAVTAGATAEQSTLDGDTHHYFGYPHFAASYRITVPSSFIEEVKPRVAYGEAGNLPPLGVRFNLPYTTCVAGVCGAGVPYPSRIKPDRERETELGFDAAMFGDRAQFSATVYQKRTTDLVLEATASENGPLFANGGAFSNRGAELELEATPLRMRNSFAWTSTTTFSRNYSVVDAVPFPVYATILGAARGYVAAGRSLTEIVNTNAPSGLQQIGDAMPSYVMSFGNALTFGRFRVFGLADWSRGGTAFDWTTFLFDFGSLSADSAAAARRAAEYVAHGSPYDESASYFTLRQVSLSYDVAPGLVRRIGFGEVSSARLTLSGFDLWSTFHYHGLDPQAEEFGTLGGTAGLEAVPYPPARSYYLGLRLGI